MLMLNHTRQSVFLSKMPDKRGGHMIFNEPERGWRGSAVGSRAQVNSKASEGS
jgi:hypothetical protein